MLLYTLFLLTVPLVLSYTIHQLPLDQVDRDIPPSPFPWIHHFASIGDSYSAGLGAGPRLDWHCSRYADSHPNLLHTSLLGHHPARTHQFLACSGQTSAEILATQIPALEEGVDVLTVSAGGNDVGLSPVLSSCVYQFYMGGEGECREAMGEARARIEDRSQLYGNVAGLLDAVRPKMRRDGRGVVYVTGYATFFGEEDEGCDDVTWAVWRAVERQGQKQYLTRRMRREMNELVKGVNGVLRRVVEDFNSEEGGTVARFVDYDERIASSRGRFCEEGVQEPAPNRKELAFYEWDTVDPGDNATSLLHQTGEDVRRGSFEGGVAELVGRTLEEHPEWEFDGGMGWVNKTKGREVRGEDLLGDTVHWLLPDSWKRVFHLRPGAQGVVARMVAEDLKELGRERREVEQGEL